MTCQWRLISLPSYTRGKKWICMLASRNCARKTTWRGTSCVCGSSILTSSTFSRRRGCCRLRVQTSATTGSKISTTARKRNARILSSRMGFRKVVASFCQDRLTRYLRLRWTFLIVGSRLDPHYSSKIDAVTSCNNILIGHTWSKT